MRYREEVYTGFIDTEKKCILDSRGTERKCILDS